MHALLNSPMDLNRDCSEISDPFQSIMEYILKKIEVFLHFHSLSICPVDHEKEELKRTRFFKVRKE